MSKTQIAFAWLGAPLAVAAIILGGWQIGWWFKGQNANRESHVIRQGYSNQQTLRDQITAKLADVFDISTQIAETQRADLQQLLRSQRFAVIGIVCGDAAQVVGDPLPADQAQFVQANCLAGAVSPTSAYR